MSFPFFPTLTPPIASSLWFDTSCICDEEAEINKEEQEHRANMDAIQNIGSDLHPVGKIPTETIEQDSDDDDANDESDDTDSHDDEDDEADVDEIDRDRRESFAVNFEVNDTL